MRVPLSWLREFAPIEADPETLADLLTSRGLKVEGIDRPWAGLDGVIVARVLDKRPHPDSDRLTLARLETGAGEGHVAAGVANWEVGDLVPYAPPGSHVPLLPEPLGVRTLRGERSEGMICSPKELAISADHGGILILPAGLVPGAPVKDALGLDEIVFDVEIKANRSDLLSILGIAREAAAVAGVPLVRPDTTVAESEPKAAEAATVEILDLERCPRYLARVIAGVAIGASPLRVQARLTAAGMRPLSNVVDATNYVMLEMGQPLHAFDMDRLAGPGIVVRRAEEGERLVTLDDQERRLAATDLVIADLEKGVAIAGVMGSAIAEVGDSTENVLLEAAHFNRRTVIRTSRRLDLRTEASARFERGVDPEGVTPAAARAAALIQAWSGGTVLAGAAEAGAVPERRRLVVRPERASLIFGQPVSAGEIVESLGRIEIPTTADAGDSAAGAHVDVEVPGFRVDLEREIDVIEEVIRVLGYDRVGATTPAVRQAGGVPDTYERRRTIRRAFAAAGFREVESYSFASPADLELMGEREDAAVRVRNPLLADEPFLRTSLIPGLLRSLRLNASRQVRGAALFEVGHTFGAGSDGGDGPSERESVAAALFGRVGAAARERGDVDVFDAKGAAEALLETFGITGWEIEDTDHPHPFHPGRAGGIVVGGHRIGRFGELHPGVGTAFDLPGRVAALEIDVEALAAAAGPGRAYRDVPRFPPVRRDLAFVLDITVPVGAVSAAIREAAGGLAGSIELFDLYEGPPLQTGKRNAAFSVEFRADRSLTNDEVTVAVEAIAAAISDRFGGEFRSS